MRVFRRFLAFDARRGPSICPFALRTGQTNFSQIPCSARRGRFDVSFCAAHRANEFFADSLQLAQNEREFVDSSRAALTNLLQTYALNSVHQCDQSKDNQSHHNNEAN
jgi:hypothetical protein